MNDMEKLMWASKLRLYGLRYLDVLSEKCVQSLIKIYLEDQEEEDQ